MGQAIVALVEHELRSVVSEPDAQPVFLMDFETGLVLRSVPMGLDVALGRLALAIASKQREGGMDPPALTTISIDAGRGDQAKPGHCPVLGASQLTVSP
jgi:hypothetical protein